MITHRAIGAASREEILFVHGAWHGAWCWEEHFMPYFAQHGYTNHAINLSRHDQAGKVISINNLRINDYVNDVVRAISKIAKPTIIIAHSMGGMVIQKYLERHLCEKAILLAPVPPSGVLRVTLKFLTKSYAYPALLCFNLYGLVNSMNKSKWAFFSNTLEDSLIKKYTQQMCSESYAAFLDMLFPNVKIGNQLSTPMLVIAAEHDNIFTIKECKATAQKYKADFQIIENIAHDMMLDTNHQDVSSSILSWIKNGILEKKITSYE